MTVDAGFARWLKEGIIYASATDTAIETKWGARARSTDVGSPLATKAGAEAEAARQLAFLGGPLVIDDHVVAGLRADLIGQPVTLTINRLGYDAGVVVFVIGAAESDQVEQTTLTVVRRLT